MNSYSVSVRVAQGCLLFVVGGIFGAKYDLELFFEE